MGLLIIGYVAGTAGARDTPRLIPLQTGRDLPSRQSVFLPPRSANDNAFIPLLPIRIVRRN